MSEPTRAEVEEFVTRMWGKRLQSWQVDQVVEYILTNDPAVMEDDHNARTFAFHAALRFDTERAEGKL